MRRNKTVSLKNRILQVVGLAALCAALSLNEAHAAWWDSWITPLPSQTRKVKEEARSIAGRKIEIIYYESSRPKEEIRDFYIQQLSGLGWKENTLLKNMPLGEDIENQQEVRQSLEDLMFFEKDKENLTVTFLPQGAETDRVDFVVSKWQKSSVLIKQGQIIPEMLKKPKKQVMPVYPEAYLTNFTENERSLTAMYAAQGVDIEEVAAFYKDKSSGYGWLLREEEPLHSASVQELAGLFKESCPSCKKTEKDFKVSEEAAKVNPELSIINLLFYNQREDVCQVVLSRSEAAQRAGLKGLIFITVNYAKKTE